MVSKLVSKPPATATLGRLLAGAALLGFAVTGCSQSGGSSTSPTVTQPTASSVTASTTTTAAPTTATPTTPTTAAPTTTPTTQAPPTTASPPPTETPPTTAAPEPLSADEAGALVAAKSGPYGNWVPDTSNYDRSAALSGVIGNTKGATGTSPQQLFLFHQGRYLGTASSTPRFAFQITETDGTTVTVRYLHYAPGDANCCPSQPPYVVRYQWNGTKVVPLDPIPPEDQGTGG